MKNGITKICIRTLDRCIESCEACIDACQLFADKCSTLDKEECARQVGICKNRSQACLEACEEAICRSQDYMSQANDLVQIDLLSHVINRCKECVEACKKNIKSCDQNTEVCNKATLESLKVCTLCAHACSRAIDALK